MNKGIEDAIKELAKRFGDGTVVRLGDAPLPDVEVISTGIPSIDQALGIKGLPKGKITEIYGQEGVSKTTLALQTVAQAQKAGEVCAFIDTEFSFNPDYALALGVDVDNLLVSQPSSAEEVFEIAEALINSGEVSVIVLDSVAALVSQAELNGEFGDAVMGVIARLMGQVCRKLVGPIAKNNVAFIFINQLRATMATGYGPASTTTGGKALKFYASIRIEISRVGALKNGDTIIGNQTKIKVVKNKYAPPYKEANVSVIFGEGISREADVLQIALDKGIIHKKGAWFGYIGENFAQGAENARKYLKENKELCAEIEAKIYEV